MGGYYHSLQNFGAVSPTTYRNLVSCRVQQEARPELTRTFYEMFGMPPSVMMRGEFFEIPSPFELPAAPERRG